MAKGGYRGGMPMGGMNQMQMMKQAQKMQQDLLKMQQEMEEKQYEATAGGGVITAVVSGKRELVRVTIGYFDFDRGYGRPWRWQVKERSAIFQGTLLRCNKHPLRLCFEDGIGGGGGLHAAGAGQQHRHGDNTYCSKLACHLPFVLYGIRE